MIVCLNGRLLDENKAHISIFDRGFLYGDGLYETMRVRDGHILFLKEHLRRLNHGCKRLRLALKWNEAQLARLLNQTVRANKLKDAVLRLTYTRGPGPHGLDPRPCKNPTLLITARPFASYLMYVKPAFTLALVSVRRNDQNSTPPDVKTISCLNNVLAKIESVDMKADEAVMLDENGFLSEGSVTNVFIVKNGALITPRLDGNQLPGVTRGHVISVARRLKIPVHERQVNRQSLLNADEIFVTNSLIDIKPVKTLLWKSEKIKRRNFDSGRVTQMLLKKIF